MCEGNFLLWAALISGASGLLGALGSQVIQICRELKVKRLELWFVRKADAYVQLMGMLGEFALDPKNIEKYSRFLYALETARLFASDAVVEALTGHDGIHVNAQRLRSAQNDNELVNVQVGTWYKATKSFVDAARLELSEFGGLKKKF